MRFSGGEFDNRGHDGIQACRYRYTKPIGPNYKLGRRIVLQPFLDDFGTTHFDSIGRSSIPASESSSSSLDGGSEALRLDRG
jgi:hypothetical protein